MQISINTPALLFPAITLLMLAYTNRFLALATLIRNLHAQYKQGGEQQDKELIKQQIKNLKRRLILIQRMQAAGISSFFCCVLCMLFFYLEYEVWAYTIFGLSLGLLMLSLIFSLNEIRISTRALEIELKDMLED
jgi:type VI protein secretion system component VasF